MPYRLPTHHPLPPRDRRDADKRYDRGTRAGTGHLAQARDIRNTARWKAFRRMFLGRYPYCANPFKGERVHMAEEVHHIRPLGEAPHLAYHESNCVALCRPCHAQIEAMERRGEDTKGLFDEL